MSTVFEPSKTGGFVAKNTGNGTGAAVGRDMNPLGLNAEKVVAKRYSLKDEHGEPLETWATSSTALSATFPRPRPTRRSSASTTT